MSPKKKNFKTGDLVWAKMKGYPPWPGYISDPPPEMKHPAKKNLKFHCIFFFGTKNFGWIEEPCLNHYTGPKEQSAKSAGLREACEEIEEHIRVNNISMRVDGEAEEEEGTEEAEETKTPAKEEDSTKKKRGRKPKESTEKADTPASARKKKMKVEKVEKEERSSPSPSPETYLPPSVSRASAASALLMRPPRAPPRIAPIDMSASETLKEKNVQPSTLKFGFLGLGIMGKGIVKNLITSGHKVVVWNRSPDKVDEFVGVGAESAITPSDVASMCDITFSCISGPTEAKKIFFGNCGIQAGLGPGKGFVEMTSIDSETSLALAQGTTSSGAKYLEAQMQGSKEEAEEGTLVILAAGDRSLYEQCHSCFQAFGRSSFFLGDVGNACKMNLVIQLMNGIALAGLAEGMALADRAGLKLEDIMEILSLTTLDCTMIRSKGQLIIDRAFSTSLPLQHLQKDLKLALSLGDNLDQPLPLAASTNEIFKHAKRLGYGDHDASAVYIRARF